MLTECANSTRNVCSWRALFAWFAFGSINNRKNVSFIEFECIWNCVLEEKFFCKKRYPLNKICEKEVRVEKVKRNFSTFIEKIIMQWEDYGWSQRIYIKSWFFWPHFDIFVTSFGIVNTFNLQMFSFKCKGIELSFSITVMDLLKNIAKDDVLSQCLWRDILETCRSLL